MLRIPPSYSLLGILCQRKGHPGPAGYVLFPLLFFRIGAGLRNMSQFTAVKKRERIQREIVRLSFSTLCTTCSLWQGFQLAA